MAWTTADLLTAIKNRQMFPDASTGSLSPAALLQYATEELYLTIVPLIISTREKYYETYQDTAYTIATPYLAIPSRAIGGSVSSVQWYYSTTSIIKPLNPIDPIAINSLQTSNIPFNFYFQNNSIVFYPPPASSYGTVRLRYFQRPNRLEQVSNCAQITAFNSGAGTVTCTFPSTWTTSNTFDFIPQTASQATPYSLNSTATNLTGTTITFTSLSSQIAVGDWIALSEFSPIPELPFELQGLLIQATCCRGLAAIGDQTNLQIAKAELKEYMDAAIKLLTPRDQQGSKKVVSNWRCY